MLAAWAGLPIGSLAFILVCYFTGHFVSAGVPVFAGAIAAGGIWYYFKRLDDRRLEALMNPEPELWPVPLAVAWGILKAAFDGPVIMPGNAPEQKLSATVGSENLSSILVRDGIVLKAKAPVTVYLEGVLTRPELSVILHAS